MSLRGRCRTISCICGNVLQEGYVFMFCCLALTSLLLVRRISEMAHRACWRHHLVKGLLITGSLLITLTGSFPERYDINGRSSGPYLVLYTLHIIGVYGSGLLLMGVPFGWFTAHWVAHHDPLDGFEHVPLLSMACRTVYVVMTLSMGVAMLVNDSNIVDETVDYCKYLKTKSECEGWPSMDEQSCMSALACLGKGAGPSSSDSLCDGLLQPNFRCAWEDSPFTAWTETIAPKLYLKDSSCVKVQCPLFQYARGVALEFAVLLFTLCYVPTFAFHDVQRLLMRTTEHAGLNSSARVDSLQPLSFTGDRQLLDRIEEGPPEESLQEKS